MSSRSDGAASADGTTAPIAARPRDAARIASIVLAAVLITLSACAFLAAFLSYRAGSATQQASELNDAFEEARSAVSAEETLERRYRLEPGPELRAKHLEAGAALLVALDRAATLGADLVQIDDIKAKHAVYLSSIRRMLAAIDAGDTATANAIDASEDDPAFEAMEAAVVSAAARHRVRAADHLRRQVMNQRALLIATPVVFVPGLGLVIFIWSLLQRYRRQSENALIREARAIRRSERRFRALVQNTADVILICGADGAIGYQSPAAETAWGYAADGLIRRLLFDLFDPQDRPAMQELWDQLKTAPGATRRTEVTIRNATDERRQFDLVLTNLFDDPAVAGLVATAHDITERNSFERQLSEKAFYDSLTGLPNRVLFRDRLDQAWVRADQDRSSIGLLFFDLDNFKQINDSLGHQAGDSLLVEVAARLRNCARDGNTVARLGGDEFVILLEQIARDEDAVDMADRIAEQFSRPFQLEGHDVVVTASIGIVRGNSKQKLADNLLRDADLAMYRAKSDGKAQHVIFDATMQTDALARLEMESDLRRAVEHGELRVHYQPIMILDGGHIAEVEALVRWQHPTRGLVAPLDFIPVAEETGLIVPIGQWVLEQACRQAAAWQSEYPRRPPLTVSVNLSPRQFQQPILLAEIKRALQLSGLPASCLKLEITESMIMRDIEATITTLRQIKKLGIKLAIDDFGTGYSSLAYLKRLPLDVLKIDRSFVDGIGHDQEDTAIVRAIISMAKSLNLSITAEGIETEEQSVMLQALDCDRGQGYYFSRPLDAAGFSELLCTAALSRSREVA